MERAIAQEFLQAPTDMEELEKEHELPFAGDGSLIVPFGVKTTSRCVDRPAADGSTWRDLFFTQWVSSNSGRGCFHILD